MTRRGKGLNGKERKRDREEGLRKVTGKLIGVKWKENEGSERRGRQEG